MQDRYRVLKPDSIAPLYEPSEPVVRTRPSLTHRPITIKTSVTKNASGSCYLELGTMKILCTVQGPKQALKSQLSTSFTFAPFALQTRAANPHMKSDAEKEFAVVMKQALMSVLKLGEKTRVDVTVVVLECDGVAASLAGAVTCASLALMNAGVEMSDIIVGCSIGMIGEEVLVDCSAEDETLNSGTMFLAYLPSSNQVAHIVQSGEVSMKMASRSMEVCIDSCAQLSSIIRQIVLNI